MQLVIYSKEITNRLTYIFRLIFDDLLGMSYKLTNDIEEFKNASQPKLNYSGSPIGNEIFIKAHTLLFEKNIHPQQITVTDWQQTKIFFQTEPPSALPFDPFAAAFYLVTRYEEYLPGDRDRYRRYMAEQSLAFKHHFLEEPIVNTWALSLLELLKEAYPDLSYKLPSYQYVPTIDIDSAYAYLHKGLLRSAGGFVRSLFRNEKGDIKNRIAVLAGRKKDDFDTYDKIEAIHDQYSCQPRWFFLLAKMNTVYDPNLSASNLHYINLIKSISAKYDVGIHPSYGSNIKSKRLKKEIAALNHITGKGTKRSRQHFLILNFPETYKRLIDYGITEDYSMGFASKPGFRAGIANPFFFYDLESEETTTLKIFPFQVMEVTLRRYMELSPEKAIKISKSLIDKTRKVNGTFISLWHNESFSENHYWEGWTRVYEELVKTATV